MEPVSPELVLVDPELRERALALLAVDAAPEPPPPPGPTAAAPTALAGGAAFARIRRGGALLLGASLFVNGYVAAHLLTRSSPAAAQGPASVAFAPPLLTLATQTATTVARTTPPAPTRAPAPVPKRKPAPRRTPHVSRVSLERRVLSLVLSLPAKKLPRRLSGGTSLQSICESNGPVDYSCIVRPAQHRPGEGLTIRYVNGRLELAGYHSG